MTEHTNPGAQLADKHEWYLGRDRFGRRVTLMRVGDKFVLDAGPIDQRDEGERFTGLTREIILAAAEAINSESAHPFSGDRPQEGEPS